MKLYSLKGVDELGIWWEAVLFASSDIEAKVMFSTYCCRPNMLKIKVIEIPSKGLVYFTRAEEPICVEE